MPAGPVADRAHRAAVEPGQEEQDQHRAAHHDDAPELGVEGLEERDRDDRRDRDRDLGRRAEAAAQDRQHRGHGDPHGHEHVDHQVGRRPQHRVVRREVPHRGDVRRRLQRIGLDEVVELGSSRRLGAKNTTALKMKRNTTATKMSAPCSRDGTGCRRAASRSCRSWSTADLDAVGVVQPYLMQGDDVRRHQAEQHQRHGDDVEAEEAVQGRVADDIVAADQQRQVRADEGHGREQVDDHLRAPVAHLAPGQQVAHEGLGHQAQEDPAAEQPDQLARLPVRAVDQAAEHVQVDDDEERRRAGVECM